MKKATHLFLILSSTLIIALFFRSSIAEKPKADYKKYPAATFAGGCFWCVEAGFEKIPGVIEAVSGYSGGHVKNPSYKQVSSGTTGHLESVRVYYDPEKLNYRDLLHILWKQINPTDNKGQFVDSGNQYRPAIFYRNEKQKKIAEEEIALLDQSGRYKKKVNIELIPFKVFYPAEEYHQDYYKKNPWRYKFYRYNSGRDQYLKKIWGDD